MVSLVRRARHHRPLGAAVALALAATTLACVDSDGKVASAPSPAGTGAAGSAGAGPSANGGDGAGGASADAGLIIINPGGAEGTQLDAGALVDLDAAPLRTCDQCGAARESACETAFARCRDQPACAAVLDCVYLIEQCDLDSSGAACVRTCVQAACGNPTSLELFFSAEACAFCADECLSDCSGYCSGLAALAGVAPDCLEGTGAEAPAGTP